MRRQAIRMWHRGSAYVATAVAIVGLAGAADASGQSLPERTVAAQTAGIPTEASSAQAPAAAPADAADDGRFGWFMPRGSYHLSAEHLSLSEPGFAWDAHFGGDVDVIDYGRGRFNFLADYQVILGNEFRRFDPNQGNYFLAGSTSIRVAGVELSAVLHHESRHLSDRANRTAVAWNMLGGRIQKDVTSGRLRSSARTDLRGVIAKAFVDYRWELDTNLANRYRLNRGVSLMSDVDLRVLGVDGTRDRGTQTGFRVEGGVRLEGHRGAIELFAAAERRIDPYPLTLGTDTWASVGFRLLNR